MEQRRTIVATVRSTAESERRACRWLGFHRSAVRYVPEHRADDALRARLRQLLAERLVMASAAGNSPLGSLRGEVETIRRRELARAMKLHPELPENALDTITRSLVNQIFHRPSLHLRHSSNHELAAAFAALFKAPGTLEAVIDGE
jgi:hypothetical protein